MAITKGSPKQIAWAENIRLGLEQKFASLEAKHGPAPTVVREFFEKKILARKDAKYFIDHWNPRGVLCADLELTLRNQDDPVGEAAFAWLTGIREV
jgi:hypothetical protein